IPQSRASVAPIRSRLSRYTQSAAVDRVTTMDSLQKSRTTQHATPSRAAAALQVQCGASSWDDRVRTISGSLGQAATVMISPLIQPKQIPDTCLIWVGSHPIEISRRDTAFATLSLAVISGVCNLTQLLGAPLGRRIVLLSFM